MDNVDLCNKCHEQPRAPKLKGQGFSIFCRNCRNQANEKVQRARSRRSRDSTKEKLHQELSKEISHEMTLDMLKKLEEELFEQLQDGFKTMEFQLSQIIERMNPRAPRQQK